MKNTIDELITALENLQEAKSILREKEKDCLYDRSWFLIDEIEAVDKAKDRLASIFKQSISDVVIEVINSSQKTKEETK